MKCMIDPRITDKGPPQALLRRARCEKISGEPAVILHNSEEELWCRARIGLLVVQFPARICCFIFIPCSPSGQGEIYIYIHAIWCYLTFEEFYEQMCKKIYGSLNKMFYSYNDILRDKNSLLSLRLKAMLYKINVDTTSTFILRTKINL